MTNRPVDILIISAADGEDDAVRAVDDGASGKWAEAPLDGHQFTVWRRSYLDAQRRSLIVALARAGQMGGEAVACAATELAELLQRRPSQRSGWQCTFNVTKEVEIACLRPSYSI